MLPRCFLDISVGVGAFVIGLSQISSFFSFNKNSIFARPISNLMGYTEGCSKFNVKKHDRN